MIKVDMNEDSDAGAPDCLYTENLGTCIGIGVIDMDTKHGYLCHYPGISHTSQAHDFFKRLSNCSQNVIITVAGGGGGPSMRSERRHVLNELNNLFPNVKPTTDWSGPDWWVSDGSRWMIVCPAAGVITTGPGSV